jgi:RNA recognition motif-containing protein
MKQVDSVSIDPNESSNEKAFYVSGLSKTTTELDLYSLFESVGTITSIKMLKDSLNQKRRTAVVRLKNTTNEQVLSLHKTVLNEKKIRVREPKSKSSSKALQDSCIVFIGNLPYTTTEDLIGTAFDSYGQIKEIRLQRDVYGNPKGSCYLEYTSSDSAAKALEMNSKVFHGKVLNVDLAEPRNIQKSALTVEYFWALEKDF